MDVVHRDRDKGEGAVIEGHAVTYHQKNHIKVSGIRVAILFV